MDANVTLEKEHFPGILPKLRQTKWGFTVPILDLRSIKVHYDWIFCDGNTNIHNRIILDSAQKDEF